MRATPTSFEDENACFRQNPDHVIFLSEIHRIKKWEEFVTYRHAEVAARCSPVENPS
jgi:hypothetical protein